MPTCMPTIYRIIVDALTPAIDIHPAHLNPLVTQCIPQSPSMRYFCTVSLQLQHSLY